MPRNHVWLLGVAVAVLGIAGCAPRFTAVVEEPPGDKAVPAAQAALAHAGSVYQTGVDFFVAGQYDSAATYLDSAVSILSEDITWAASGTILGERRLLLYKCRYFLERVPEPEPGTEPSLAGLDDIKPLKPQLPPIEIMDNDKVQKWLRYFTHDVRKNFQEWITRSGKYMPATLRILKEEGMPMELTNLALIESGFNPSAYSRAHAAGIWQFIKSTGKLYGLRVDSYVDERRHPDKSCRAAARHLRDLYNIFNDWPLAMAAYNAGAGGVEKAIKRSHTSDYWRLSLKRETRDYVPMFMAAAIIMSDPGKYGFDCRYDRPIEFDEVEVGARTSLKAVARACQVEPGLIAELNPHLIKHCTPEAGSASVVRIPREKADLFAAEFARIPREERVAKVSEPAASDGRHTVRRGETLSKIAKKYGTTVDALAQANNIKNRHSLRVGQVLAVPGSGEPVAKAASVPENPSTHTVRRGETLSGISRKYGIGLSDLLAWNDIRSNDLLQPGQKIIVSGSKASRERIIVHKVRRGDTINAIAQKYGASTGTVLKTNGLRASDKIYPGQRIKIPVKAST
jgi:membrane-bound lytic murein transglycosylase D